MATSVEPLRIDDIVGLPLVTCTRILDMLRLGFGVLEPYANEALDRTRLAATFEIDIQSTWRLTFDQQIVTSARDVYYDESGVEFDSESLYQTSHSLMDERFRVLFSWMHRYPTRVNEDIHGFIVVDARVNKFGDLEVNFKTGHRLQTFTSDSVSEQWRLFAPRRPGPDLVYPEQREDES